VETERDLVRRVLARDSRAVGELVDRHRNLVRRIVFRLVDDPRDREEVAQDTFLNAIRSLHAFRGDAKLSTWIARIAYREAMQHLRRRRDPSAEPEADLHLETHDSAAPTAVDVLARKELEAFVAEAVGRLTPVQRAVVTLYYLEEMDVAEVADVIGIPANTVKSHLARSRIALRHLLVEEARARGYTT
jgi:RNA polymerase sigma-70 factor (ECF subfamily)